MIDLYIDWIRVTINVTISTYDSSWASNTLFFFISLELKRTLLNIAVVLFVASLVYKITELCLVLVPYTKQIHLALMHLLC